MSLFINLILDIQTRLALQFKDQFLFQETMKAFTKREEYYETELRELNRQLSVKRTFYPGQSTIFTKEAIEAISQEFEYLKKHPKLNFEHTLIKNEVMTENDDTMTIRSVRRIVKLRFKCINQKCSNFHCKTETQNGNGNKAVLKEAQIRKPQAKKTYVSKEETPKSEASKKQEINKEEQVKEKEKARMEVNMWTSYYGLVDFRFFLQKIPKSKSTMLGYSFYIYRQKCKVCEQWGKCGLIKSTFYKLLDLYYLIVKQTLFKIKENRQREIQWRDCEKYGRRPEMKGVFNSHKQKLCQACDQGLCLRFYNESELNLDSGSDQEEKEEEYQVEYIAGSNSLKGRYR